MFNNGFKLALKEGLDSNRIRIIDEAWADDWRLEEAYNTVSKAINEGKRIDAIIGGNDRLAEGALKLFQRTGLLMRFMW